MTNSEILRSCPFVCVLTHFYGWAMSFDWFATLIQTEISQLLDGFAVKMCTDINRPWGMIWRDVV